MGVIASLPALFPRAEPEVVGVAAETWSDVTATAEARRDVTVAETRSDVTAAVTRTDVTVAKAQSGVTAAETQNCVTVRDEGNVGIIANQVTAGNLTFNLGDTRSEAGKCMATLASNYAGNKDRNPERVPGTCNWFLKHAMFRDWPRDRSKNLLWVSADPGCGKSVLSRALVDEGLLKSDISDTTCYFFFKEDDINRRTGADALCAILHQIFTKKPALLSKHVLDPGTWTNNGEKLRTQFETLWDILMSATVDCDEGDNASWVVCVLDALDECERAARIALVVKLGRFHLAENQKKSRLKFIVTSRPYAEIQAEFGYNTGDLPHIHLKGETESEIISQEIDLYIEDQIPRIARARDPPLSEEIQVRLVERLKETENRTYLWLHLVIQEIKTSLEYTTKKLERVLEGLPTSVSDAYQNILEKVITEERGGRRIPNPRRMQEVKRLLHLIVAAARPLTVREIRIAVELLERQNSGESCELEDDLDSNDPDMLRGFANKIRNLCGLFVNVMDSKIYLIHQTAKEFLVANNPPELPHVSPAMSGFGWKHSLWPPESHMALASACMLYLLLPKFERPELGIGSYDFHYLVLVGDQTKNGFLRYAMKYCAGHITSAEETRNQSLTRLASRVCGSRPRLVSDEMFFHPYFPSKRQLNWQAGSDEELTDLVVASRLGLGSVVRLLAQGKEGDELSLALYEAIMKGRDDLVQHLLENGASGVLRGSTALHAAAFKGHDGIVRLLLDHGFPINRKDVNGETALHLAVAQDKVAVVQLLVERNADLNIQRPDEQTALGEAIGSRKWDIVELLLKAGADAQYPTSGRLFTLYLAAQDGREFVVRSLLASGYAADEENFEYFGGWEIPLVGAAGNGHEGVVRLLLANGADVDAKSHNGETALTLAAKNGHEGVVRLLLANGADVDAKSDNGETALTLAAKYDHAGVVRLLFANGANMGEHGMITPYGIITPLLNASRSGYESVVRLLLENGAHFDETKYGLTPLQLAAASGHKGVVRLLLESGADVNKHCGGRRWEKLFDIPFAWSPLHLAARHGHTSVVKLLIQHGADVDGTTEENETALIVAARCGHHETARCLVESGADIDAESRDGMTAFAWATRNEDQDLIQFLTEKRL